MVGIYGIKSQFKAESAANTGSAVNGKFSAHHFHDIFCDRQPKPGSAVHTGCRRFGLRKRIKYFFYLFRGHPNAWIFYLKEHGYGLFVHTP